MNSYFPFLFTFFASSSSLEHYWPLPGTWEKPSIEPGHLKDSRLDPVNPGGWQVCRLNPILAVGKDVDSILWEVVVVESARPPHCSQVAFSVTYTQHHTELSPGNPVLSEAGISMETGTEQDGRWMPIYSSLELRLSLEKGIIN